MREEHYRKAYRFTSRWESGRMEPGAVSLLRIRGCGVDVEEGGVPLGSSPERAADALRRAFGPELVLDEVPARCAMVLYDTAVSMGTAYACAMARRALGLPSGRRWDAVLRTALRHCDDGRTAQAMCHLRRARYCEIVGRAPVLRDRLKGWLRRVDALEEALR